MFNARPVVQALPLFDGHECLVIDDALADPAGWVERVAAHQADFRPSRYAYPGPELWLDDDSAARLDAFFVQHARARLGGRRSVHHHARLSLATLPPHELQPRQWLCHRDSAGLPADQMVAASVLYLFHDSTLGGTSFYRPRRPMAEVEQLVHDCSTLDSVAFRARRPEVEPGYPVDSNAWFERVATVPARWNRLIVYDGGLFHSADLRRPERLTPDVRHGRLTMNGFFTCRRATPRGA